MNPQTYQSTSKRPTPIVLTTAQRGHIIALLKANTEIGGPMGTCYLWTGPVNSCGYGVLRIDGQAKLVHRVAKAMQYRRTVFGVPTPQHYDVGSTLVRHECDTPRCWNPSHTVLGSAQDNSDDAQRRRRVRKLRQLLESYQRWLQFVEEFPEEATRTQLCTVQRELSRTMRKLHKATFVAYGHLRKPTQRRHLP